MAHEVTCLVVVDMDSEVAVDVVSDMVVAVIVYITCDSAVDVAVDMIVVEIVDICNTAIKHKTHSSS